MVIYWMVLEERREFTEDSDGMMNVGREEWRRVKWRGGRSKSMRDGMLLVRG